MAVWQMVGGTISATDLSLMENITLTGIQPADYDPASVTEIVVEWQLNITGGLADDSWTDRQSANLCTSSGQVVGTAIGGPDVTRNDDGSWPKTGTITAPSVQLSPTENTLRAPTGTWATFNKTKSPDVTTATIVGVAVRVTYTPKASAPLPVASFTADKTTVPVGGTVTFTDTSTGPPDWYYWDFGAGSVPTTASTPGPHVVTYNTAGTANVALVVGNASGEDEVDSPTIITVEEAAPDPPVASYEVGLAATGRKVKPGETIVYTDTSTGEPHTWQWEFGEGAVPQTANTQGPHTVTYPTVGTYTVEMGVANDVGTDTAPVQTITVEEMVAGTVPTLVRSGRSPAGNQLTCDIDVTGARTLIIYRNLNSGVITVDRPADVNLIVADGAQRRATVWDIAPGTTGLVKFTATVAGVWSYTMIDKGTLDSMAFYTANNSTTVINATTLAVTKPATHIAFWGANTWASWAATPAGYTDLERITTQNAEPSWLMCYSNEEVPVGTLNTPAMDRGRSGTSMIEGIVTLTVLDPVPIHTLTDTFDTQVDPNIWPTLNRYGTVAWDPSGRVAMTELSATYSGMLTAPAFNLNESSCYVRAWPQATQTASSECTLGVRDKAGNNGLYFILYADSGVTPTMCVRLRTNKTNNNFFYPYNPTADAYIRVRLAGGNAYWDTSPDAITWTNKHTLATTLQLPMAQVDLSIGQWAAQATQTTGYFDNLNSTGVAQVAPVAAFTASTTTVTVGSTVTFTDTSTNAPNGWSWFFGTGATPATASTQGPHTVTYATPGSSAVYLIAGNAAGSDQSDTTNITVSSSVTKPVASISASVTTVIQGGTVTFTDTSTNTPTGWYWDFGFGASPATAATKGPHTVTYNTVGISYATLVATNTAGSDEVDSPTAITVAAPFPKVANLIDDFKTLDTTTKWSVSAGRVSLDAERLKIVTLDNTAAYHYAASRSTFDLRESSVMIEVVDVGNQTLLNFEAMPLKIIDPAWSVEVGFNLNQNWLVVYNGVQMANIVAWSAATRWLRIRETAGTVYYEYSATGVAGSWTVLNSHLTSAFVAPVTASAVRVLLGCGAWTAVMPASQVILDNVNNLPTAPVGGRPKVNVSGSWVTKPAKVYLAGSWQEKPMKRWNGTAWVPV